MKERERWKSVDSECVCVCVFRAKRLSCCCCCCRRCRCRCSPCWRNYYQSPRKEWESNVCCAVCVPKSNSRAAVAVVAAGRRKINCRSGSCHCHCRLQSYRGHCVAHSLRLSTPPNWPLNQVAFVFFAVPIDTAKCVLALGARVFVVLLVMFSCRNSRSSEKSPLIAPLLSLSTSTWIHFVLLYPFLPFSFCVMLKIYFIFQFYSEPFDPKKKKKWMFVLRTQHKRATTSTVAAITLSCWCWCFCCGFFILF